MSNRQITIAIDAMGGDQSPFKTLKGSEIFSNLHPEVKLKWFGDKKLISKISIYSTNNVKINTILPLIIQNIC